MSSKWIKNSFNILSWIVVEETQNAKPKRLWKWVIPGTIHENGGVGDWTSALKLLSYFA